MNNNATLTATARNAAYRDGNTELNRVMTRSLNLLNDGVSYREKSYVNDGLKRYGYDISNAQTLSGRNVGSGIIDP